MTFEEALQQTKKAVKAAIKRRNIEHFDDPKNIKELLIDLDYRLNPPAKTGRKHD